MHQPTGDIQFFTTLPLNDGERVLVMPLRDPQHALALARTYPRTSFHFYQPNLALLQELEQALRSQLHTQHLLQGMSDITALGENAQYDAAIFEVQRFVAHDLIEAQIHQCLRLLRPGGRLYLGTNKNSGGATHQRMLGQIFQSPVRRISKGKKGTETSEAIKPANQQELHPHSIRRPIEFEILGRHLRLETEPSLFSKEGLDEGTRLLLEQTELGSFRHLLDLGCGWGALGIVAALANPLGQATLIDIDTRAVQVAHDNIVRLELQQRVTAIATNAPELLPQRFDLVLSNPPFHADNETLTRLFNAVQQRMTSQATIAIVVEKTYHTAFAQLLQRTFGNAETTYQEHSSKYVLLTSHK